MALQLAPTLLDSYDWLVNCPDSWRDRAFDGLKSTLGRVWGGMTPAMQAGIDFEKLIYKYANDPDFDRTGLSKHVQYFLNRVEGFTFQKTYTYKLNVDGVDYFFKCKLDAWSKDEVVDIKTTGNFRGDSQYLSKWQHRVYPLATGIPKFAYVVAEWKDLTKSKEILDVHEVPFNMVNRARTQEEVAEKVREFIDFLSYDKELENLYLTKYNKYNTRA